MIEQTLAALTAAITENTAALREVLAASGAPTNVTPIAEAPKPAKKKAEKVEPVKEEHVKEEHVKEEPVKEEPVKEEPVKEEPAAVVEPEPVAEETPEPETTPEPEPENTLDPEALIAQITDAWKATLTAADPERKVMLKAKFPELRAKWGLEADAKLITLSSTPEKLAGLLADIKSL